MCTASCTTPSFLRQAICSLSEEALKANVLLFVLIEVTESRRKRRSSFHIRFFPAPLGARRAQAQTSMMSTLPCSSLSGETVFTLCADGAKDTPPHPHFNAFGPPERISSCSLFSSPKRISSCFRFSSCSHAQQNTVPANAFSVHSLPLRQSLLSRSRLWVVM
jgi:hypothetical protein